MKRVLAKTLRPEGGWIVRSHIGWSRELNTIYKGVETSPSKRVLKTLRGSPKMKVQRGQYLLAVDFGRYKALGSMVKFKYNYPMHLSWS